MFLYLEGKKEDYTALTISVALTGAMQYIFYKFLGKVYLSFLEVGVKQGLSSGKRSEISLKHLPLAIW